MNYRTLQVGTTILLAQTVAGAGNLHAQSNKGAQVHNSAIDEVIVTAERRESTLQDTDISMSVFGDQTLRELGVDNYQHIGDFSPNVKIHEQAAGRAGAAVNIRGVKNAESWITFDPKVALYLDGVLIAKNAGSAFDIVDLERVEVLRGPQGTLYGRNTVGGAINLITKKPRDEFGGNLSLTLGNYGQRDIKGTVNIPLVGSNGVVSTSTGSTLNLKATLASLNRDGYWDNDFEGSPDDDLGDKDREAGHIQLQWNPANNVSVLYAYDFTDIDETGTPYMVTEVDPDHPIGGLLEPYVVTDNPSSISVNVDAYQKLEVDGHNLTAEVQLTDNLALTSITGYRETENAAYGDADGSPLSTFKLDSIAGFEHEQLTQELRLVGNTLNNRLDYVIGAFYMNEEGSQYAASGLTFGYSTNLATLENDIWAVFGESTYSLTDRLELTTGLRYTKEEREMAKQEYFLAPGGDFLPGPNDSPTLNAPLNSNTWEDISGTVSLTYHWTDDLMTYAKVSKGYASGGFNARAPTVEAFNNPYDEETLIAYELGWKSSWLGNRLVINGATFFSDYSDLQVNKFDPETQGNNIGNAGDAEIRGLELEVQASPTDNLSLGGSYSYLDPDYLTYIDPLGNDLSNANWPHSPKHSVHLYGRYVVRDFAGLGDLTGRIDWMWQDDITFLSITPEFNSQPAYDHVNARLTLDKIAGPGQSSFRVSLWGKNLSDQQWWTTGVNLHSAFGYSINSNAAPRTWGIDLELDF